MTSSGFEIPPELKHNLCQNNNEQRDSETPPPAKRRMPISKFEAIPDDLEPDEVLARAQASSREARAKLATRGGGPSMGFLRQKKDGTTTLNILVSTRTLYIPKLLLYNCYGNNTRFNKQEKK